MYIIQEIFLQEKLKIHNFINEITLLKNLEKSEICINAKN